MKFKIMLTTMMVLFITMNSYADSPVIRFRVREAAPAYFKDKNGTWTGFVVEQAKAIAKGAGLKILYIDMPWKRALFSLEEGSLDLLGNMSITDERKQFTNFIGPHRFEQMRIIVSENSNYQIQNHEDLRKIPGKLSLIRGLWYGEEMKILVQEPTFMDKIHWVSGSKLATQEIERLRIGRVKAIIYPDFFVKNMDGIKYHPFIISSNPVYFGVSKKVSKIVLDKLNQSANHLVETGEFERIENKFH